MAFAIVFVSSSEELELDEELKLDEELLLSFFFDFLDFFLSSSELLELDLLDFRSNLAFFGDDTEAVEGADRLAGVVG